MTQEQIESLRNELRQLRIDVREDVCLLRGRVERLTLAVVLLAVWTGAGEAVRSALGI